MTLYRGHYFEGRLFLLMFPRFTPFAMLSRRTPSVQNTTQTLIDNSYNRIVVHTDGEIRIGDGDFSEPAEWRAHPLGREREEQGREAS
jgi:hypothetical protein